MSKKLNTNKEKRDNGKERKVHGMKDQGKYKTEK